MGNPLKIGIGSLDFSVRYEKRSILTKIIKKIVENHKN
jgi:hypothetical protein